MGGLFNGALVAGVVAWATMTEAQTAHVSVPQSLPQEVTQFLGSNRGLTSAVRAGLLEAAAEAGAGRIDAVVQGVDRSAVLMDIYVVDPQTRVVSAFQAGVRIPVDARRAAAVRAAVSAHLRQFLAQ